MHTLTCTHTLSLSHTYMHTLSHTHTHTLSLSLFLLLIHLSQAESNLTALWEARAAAKQYTDLGNAYEAEDKAFVKLIQAKEDKLVYFLKPFMAEIQVSRFVKE